MPVSKATNAYELLAEMIAIIYEMGDYTPDSIRQHAERWADHIRTFMAENEAQLKAKRV